MVRDDDYEDYDGDDEYPPTMNSGSTMSEGKCVEE